MQKKGLLLLKPHLQYRRYDTLLLLDLLVVVFLSSKASRTSLCS